MEAITYNTVFLTVIMDLFYNRFKKNKRLNKAVRV